MAEIETRQDREQQRLVATQISIVLADLTVNHGIEFDRAVTLCSNALYKSYWGAAPSGDVGPIVEVD